MEDDKEILKPEKFKLNKLFESKVVDKKCPPSDANIILVLGKLYQKVESMQTLLNEKENRICQLESNYKDLHECYRNCIKSQKSELDDLEEKWKKINDRNKFSFDGKLNDVETLFYTETATINNRFDDFEQNVLNIVRENEDIFLLQIKSMKDTIAQNITKSPPHQANQRVTKSLPRQANQRVTKSPPRQANQRVTKLPPRQANQRVMKSPPRQAKQTTRMPLIKRESIYDSDVTYTTSDSESVVLFDTNKNNLQVNDTEKNLHTFGNYELPSSDNNVSKSNNDVNSLCVGSVPPNSERQETSFAPEASFTEQENGFCNNKDEDDINMNEEDMCTSDVDSDMMVEVATVDSDSDQLQNLSSNSEDDATKFESKYEILNNECGVFRWYIEDFHDIQFSGFDIYSPQFTIDYLVYFELKISWFDELKESIVLELVTSESSTCEQHSAIITCEGNGCFNSQVIFSNEKPNEPFLSIDRTDVEITERCTSKTLCDFVENNVLFINCYFSFKDMTKGFL